MSFARVGAQTLASQAAARRKSDYTAPYSGGQWIPPAPVIPAGAYNPALDIELAAGKRGTANTIEDLLTKNTRGENNFVTDESEVHRQEGEQGAEHSRALAALSQGYARLAGRQREQANGAGVARGGALQEAAAKRTANEGRAQAPINTTYANQQAGDQRSLGRLALARQQEAEDIASSTSRAEREQNQFGIDTRTVEGREASNNGYIDPGGVIARTSVQPGAGFVKVGQPLKRF